MKVLITGAAGFVGFHTAMEFTMHGHDVICLDNFNNYYSQDLKRYRGNLLARKMINIKNLELRNREEVISFVKSESPNLIVHLAAQAGVRLMPGEFYKYNDSNLIGFSNILEAAANCGVSDFLYASSSSVYGNSTRTPYKEEDKDIQPISYYGATKLANEMLAKSFSASSNLRTRALRFFTAYGPMGRPDMAYFKLIAAAFSGAPFHLNGNGQLKRDFTYISDIVQSVYQLSIELNHRNESFSDSVNIGGGTPVSIETLIQEIQDQSGRKIEVVPAVRIKEDVKITEADPSYLKSLIGTFPQIDLHEGIRKTLQWSSEQEIQIHLKSWAGM